MPLTQFASSLSDRDPRAPRGDELIRRYRGSGDARWRTQAIESYMPLAHKLARRYHPGPEPLEDLLQVAYVGLVKAVDRFDPEAGTRFASFAIPTIVGELRRHFRDTTWSLHVPRNVQEDVLRLRQLSRELSERRGHAPTVGELSASSGLGPEQVTEALQAKTARATSSLDHPARRNDDTSATIGDMIGCEDHGFDLVEQRTALAPALRALPDRDREILYLRFAEDMTQVQIGERIGCSQMQVSRVLRRVLNRLGSVE